MESKKRVGLIGLGQRGMSLIPDTFLVLGVDIVAVCDSYQDRVDEAKKIIFDKTEKHASGYTDYIAMLKKEHLDAVIVCTSWETHLKVAEDCMDYVKYIAIEVGGLYTLEDGYRIIAKKEQTGAEVSMIENCCYARDELMVMNMVRNGDFGEVVHCEGGYRHDLREEVTTGREKRHYRFRNYLNRNCENYPTHELGPISNVLNINHGNRFVSLISVGGPSKGLHQYIGDHQGKDYDAYNFDFKQSDIVTTILKCENGETVTIFLDTSLPRFYSRQFTVHGTKALYTEDNKSLFFDGNEEHRKYEWHWDREWNNVAKYHSQYDHPIWKTYDKIRSVSGHGGIDFLSYFDFFNAVENNLPAPVDIYDGITWMAVACLSEESIKTGKWVDFPDFTNGKYKQRKPWEPYKEYKTQDSINKLFEKEWMKNYIDLLYTRLKLPKESYNDLINAYNKTIENAKSEKILLSIYDLYRSENDIDYTEILKRIEEISSLTKVNIYTTNLLVILLLCRKAENFYILRGYERSFFEETFKDIGYKITECKLVKGVYGIFVPTWYKDFFNMHIFSFGRLQYQLYDADFEYKDNEIDIKKGDKLIGVHIPRSGEKLDFEKVKDSIDKATKFFSGEYFKKDFNGKLIFTCFSWLLFEKTQEFVKNDSNIKKFASLFKKIKSIEFENYNETWRLFDVDFDGNIDNLPEKTSLQKKYKEYFKKGGKFGDTQGYFVKL